MPAIKQCIIINEKAGSAAELVSTFERLGPHSVFRTQQRGDATRFAREAVAAGYDRVIAAGGDGTLNEVLNGLVDGFGRVQLGLIPLGTANDFARAINVPADAEAAIEVLLAGRTRRCDVVQLTAHDSSDVRYFINVSAGGFSTRVDMHLDRETKLSWGVLAYAVSALKSLPELEAFSLQVRFDDEPPQLISAYNVVVANAPYVGGGIPVAPGARPDDGLLEVVIFKAASVAALLALLPRVVLGAHVDDENIVFQRARRFQIDSYPTFEMNTDGEVFGCCPATFSIVPAAIDVVVGPEAEETGEE